MDGLHLTLIWLGVALLCTTGAHSQSLSGLRIGDPVTATDRIGSAPVTVERSGLFTIAKWLLADGPPGFHAPAARSKAPQKRIGGMGGTTPQPPHNRRTLILLLFW